MAKKKKPRRRPAKDPDWMLPTEVASVLKLNYQTARNRMLAGHYGEPIYDEKSGKLRVRSGSVHASKVANGKTGPSRRPSQ